MVDRSTLEDRGSRTASGPDPRWEASGAAILYRDRWIECTTTAVIIRGYYFPFGGRKTVPYERIHGVRTVPMGPFTGRGRIWGSGDFKHWAHFDPERPHKRTALLLDVGSFFIPVMTPDDPARVRTIIETVRGRVR